jgi:hypothetical protein
MRCKMKNLFLIFLILISFNNVIADNKKKVKKYIFLILKNR